MVRDKDQVIAKKERLIEEYKADIEKERREKSDQAKKIKELQQGLDENKYLLHQKGNSQSEISKQLDGLSLKLQAKQAELQEKSN